jgi:large subunit ribosomal protein L25
MATTISLTADHRTALGRKVGALRRSGKLPGVLYGPSMDAMPLEFDAHDTTRILARLGGTRLFDINVGGEPHLALLREIQRDSIRGTLLHVDFYQVAMDRAIRVTVPINMVGTAPGEQEGVLMHGLTEVEIECLPGDMLTSVDVDLGVLKAIGDAIHVRDLYVPKTVKVLTDGDELVARVTYQVVEEEPTPAVEEVPTTTEPELVERRRKEEEEAEAGEEE